MNQPAKVELKIPEDGLYLLTLTIEGRSASQETVFLRADDRIEIACAAMLKEQSDRIEMRWEAD